MQQQWDKDEKVEWVKRGSGCRFCKQAVTLGRHSSIWSKLNGLSVPDDLTPAASAALPWLNYNCCKPRLLQPTSYHKSSMILHLTHGKAMQGQIVKAGVFCTGKQCTPTYVMAVASFPCL